MSKLQVSALVAGFRHLSWLAELFAEMYEQITGWSHLQKWCPLWRWPPTLTAAKFIPACRASPSRLPIEPWTGIIARNGGQRRKQYTFLGGLNFLELGCRLAH